MFSATPSFTARLRAFALLCGQAGALTLFPSANARAAAAEPEGVHARAPCPDSTGVRDQEESGFRARDGMASGWFAESGTGGYEECDPDEDALFGPSTQTPDGLGSDGSGEGPAPAKARATFTVTGAPGLAPRRVLSHRATAAGWSHDVTLRDDTLSRRRFTWSRADASSQGDEAPALRVSVGDLTDTALRIWPRGLPRRALPAGWSAATGTPERPQAFRAPVPQGAAAGVARDGWSAWTTQAWNPVTTRQEPPWVPARTLRHASLGVTMPLQARAADPDARAGALTLSAAQTRITRANVPAPDSLPSFEAAGDRALSERTLAAEVGLPASRTADDARRGRLTVAWNERDAEDGTRESRGGMAALELTRRFTVPPLRPSSTTRAAGEDEAMPSRVDGRRGYVVTLALTARQRTAGWASSWDPAVPAASAEGEGANAWGAGEARLAAQWKSLRGRGGIRGTPAGFAREENLPLLAGTPVPDRATAEFARVWNPANGTERTTWRGGTGWTLDRALLDLTATRRVSRSAGGTRGLHHFARAEVGRTDFPRARLAAWRAWDAGGPTRAGLFAGAAPAWNPSLSGTSARVVSEAGLHLEKTDHWPAEVWTMRAVAGLSLRAEGWELAGDAETPLGSRERAEGFRWRLTLTLTR